MKKQTVTVLSGLVGVCLLFALARTVSAEMKFDPQRYRDMVDASSSTTIPPGTKITVHNWSQYKNFMPGWIQAAFSGDYHWKFGPEPEFTIDVGPTTDYPLPKRYLDDTEKYKDQLRLQKMPWGGYTIKNYTAGIPFPKPTEPDMAAKILYNAWLPYRPFVSRYTTHNWQVDRFGNVFLQETDDTFFQLAFLSDEKYPTNTPWANGYFQAGHYVLLAPEQTKYTNELQLQPMDPLKLQELYVFLPTLRRSLRLSSAARCTPLLGTDYIADDGAWLPPNFNPTLLGEKKLLMIIMDPAKAYDATSYQGGGGTKSGSFPGWPKAGSNHWEVRDTYVLDLLAVAERLGTYCYSHRIFYVDKATWIGSSTENYDRNSKLYKLLWLAMAPKDVKGQNTIYVYSTSMSMAMDFQNDHVTANNDTPVQIDDAVPAEFRNAAVWASPGGLSTVMK